MTAPDAWAVYRPALAAATVDVWSDQDYEDEPAFRQVADDLAADRVSPVVLDEIEQHLDCDWCTGKLHTAALTVLAAHGRLERYDPAAVMTRRPRTRVLLGTRWMIG